PEAGDDYEGAMVAGWFSANDTLSWQRDDAGGPQNVEGHYYVFEALNGEFSVQARNFGIATGSASNTVSINSAAMGRTFLIASYRTPQITDDAGEVHIEVYLNSSTEIKAERYITQDSISDIRVFAVTFSDLGTVQRGNWTYAPFTDQVQDSSLIAVDTNYAMAWNIVIPPGIMPLNTTAGEFCERGYQKLTILNSTTIQGDRAESGSTEARGRWEVIDWRAYQPGIDTDSISTCTGGDTQTDNWSHTVTASGSDRILIVEVSYVGGTDNYVDSLTYGGQALTLAGEIDQSLNVGTEIWYLVNPPTGTNTVSLSMYQQNMIKCGAASFVNVDQATPLGSFFSASGLSDSVSVDVTGVNEGELVIDSLAVKSADSATVGADQTELWNEFYLSEIRSAASTEPSPDGGGTVSMSWSLGSSIEWAIGAVALKPANATAVNLLSFSAAGENGAVRVVWQTAHEIDNMGFYLYRSESAAGPFMRLNERLIPGAEFSTMGKLYEYLDTSVTRGGLYYYRLVDVDTHGKWTYHGPICVDWDADGMPDDWEISHGLDPTLDDADLDLDGDGLTNLREYARSTDPTNPDSDGDGILDGDEYFDAEVSSQSGSRSLTRGVYLLAEDETGVTLELCTDSFEIEAVDVGNETFERVRISEYVHGYTAEVGKPQLPLKGILLDIPQGKSANITVLETDTQRHFGYRIYPSPAHEAVGQGQTAQVSEIFALDEAAYQADGFYPEAVAQIGAKYVFRDQPRQQVRFYPLAFNAASGELILYTRIRVRVEYADEQVAMPGADGATAWTPPVADPWSEDILDLGKLTLAWWSPPVLRPPVSPALSVMGMVTQALWVPPAIDSQTPVYKMFAAEEGIYRLTRDYLSANGVTVDQINLSQVRLYHLGQEQAVSIYDADGDNQLDAADYIEFYAIPVDSRYAKYGKYNVYWLVLEGGGASAKRMGTVDGSPAAGALAATHDFTLHYESDDGYWQEAPGEDAMDRWYIGTIARGDQVEHAQAGQPVDIDLPVADVGGDAQGSLKILMIGGYDTDHEVQVAFEGVVVGSFNWSGLAAYEAVIDPLAVIDRNIDGNYTVSMTCLSGLDKIVFDWFELTYPRQFVAAADNLKFTHPTGYRFEITGFSSDELMVFDITSATDPVRVLNGQISGSGLYTLAVEPPGSGSEHTYLALAAAELKTPVSIVEDSSSALGDTTHGADYILITHTDLGWDGSGQTLSWVDDLVALREDQGLRVKVVDVVDIYDEFSFGLVTPAAIRDFLSYAFTHWHPPAPQYVLLVGDSSYDYKDNWGLGTINYVPAYLTYTDYMGETVTDEWYTKVSGADGLSDIYIGRLPATSAAEAAAMVVKIIDYETTLNTKSWEKNTVLVADDRVEIFETVFEAMNEDAAGLLPAGMNMPFKGYLLAYLQAGFAPADLTADILGQIDAGTLMVNFSGHGYLEGWTDELIFDAGDVSTLNNGGKYPFIVSMSCLSGYFAYPEAWGTSLAEVLLRAANKGTAAAMMPTGMTTTEGQYILNTALIEALFREDVRTLGPAIANAKQVLLANG
ncbi:MAG: C25 family cysteine peptidase, partial [Phycisphaerales bacterium]